MATPDTPDAQSREQLRERIAELEAEIQRRDEDEAAARSRRDAAAAFAGEVAIGAVAGHDVKQHAREAWTAWRRFGRSPRQEALPEDETRELAVSVLARLTRVRLVYVLAAVIPSAFILAQTVLLYQQNARFDRQNNLIAFEQTTALRDLLFIPPFDSLGQAVPNYQVTNDSLPYDPYIYRWTQPNESTVEQILSFATDEPDIVVSALRPLVRDDAPTVSIGALRVLALLDPTLINTPIVAHEGHFIGANLDGANLQEANLNRADLRGADLTGATLTGARLRSADLSGANLSKSDMRNTILSGLNYIEFAETYLYLREAESRGDKKDLDLRNVEQDRLIVSGADLSGADLSGVNMDGANIFCVQNPPEGFVEGALRQGATINDSMRLFMEARECGDAE